MQTKAVFLLLLASLAPAQSVLIRVQQDGNIAQVANGGSVNVNAAGLNHPRLLTVTVTYLGTTSLQFPQSPQLLGSSAFSFVEPPSALALRPNQSLNVRLRFLPQGPGLAQAEMDLPYEETAAAPAAAPGNPPPSAAPARPGLIVVGLTGTVPDFALHYGFPPDGNSTGVPDGGLLAFSGTVVNTAASAAMLLANRGSGPGQVLRVEAAGEAFTVAALPILPATVAARANLPFEVRYRPRRPGTDSGVLTLTLEGGGTYSITLRGNAVSSNLSYELLTQDGEAQSISTALAAALPSTAVGERTTVFIRLRNAAPADVPVTAIAITGDGFQLAGLPFLPLSMPPGDVQLFTVHFAPLQAGRHQARLRVGAEILSLAADAVGPQLSYSYRSPAGSIAVQPLGTVLLPAAQIGQSETVDFTVRNSGTAPAPLVSLAIVAEGRPAFSLVAPPAVPLAIAPNASISFRIRFTPLASGLAGASLRIGAEAFTLAGIGSQPEPLPEISIHGPSSVQALAQPSVSLTLASPYSASLSGTLTLSQESDSFAGDPSVLFVTGGRVANFTIPAGSTRAIFSNGASELKFQSGSVAGTIVARAAIAAPGGLNLTPEPPPIFRAVLAPSAPKIAAISLDAQPPTGFTLLVIGHTTTRALTRLTVSFKGKPGFHFNGAEFTQDLQATSYAWFNSPDAGAFGGQFVLHVPVALRTSDSSASAIPPLQAIESISVTVANAIGTSSAATISLP